MALTDEQLRDTDEFRNIYAYITETNWTGYDDVCRRSLNEVRAGLSELDMIILEQKANK